MMHFCYFLSFLSLLSAGVNARATARFNRYYTTANERNSLVRREDPTTLPSCATACVDTYTSIYCGSSSNTTCLCSDSEYKTAVLACAYVPCNITETLQYTRYSAETCGVAKDTSKIDEVLLMDYILPPLVTLFIIGRLCARIRLDVGLGWDDYMLVSAYFAYIITVSTSLGLVLNKFGEHVYWLTTGQVIRALKFFFLTEIFYMVSTTLTKLSLLLFFLRIFPSQRLRQISWTLGIFIVVSNLAITVALGFQCVPFDAYWTNWMYKTPPVKCIDQFAALHAAAGLGIFHNLAILVLPVPTLWSLNLPWQRKLNLLIMFSIGSLVVIFSCLRLPSLTTLRTSDDVSYDQAPIIVWSHLEQAIGLITACLPACRSLLEHILPVLKMSHISSRNKTSGTVFPGTGSKHAALGTSARSFIELHDRMPGMSEAGDSRDGDFANEKSDTEMSLQEVLAGAPSGTCKNGGCKKMGFGHETRVAGGGKDLPESVLVPMRALEERERRSTSGKSARRGSTGGGRGMSMSEKGIGEAWGRDRESIGIAVLGGCNGESKIEGVIVCTKTVEYSHEKI